MAKRRVVCTYILLVGLPLLGLMCVLRAGATLTAPLAVRGIWTVQADLNSWQGVPCGKLLTGARQPMLNIAQSGRILTGTLNNPQKTVLIGTISGATVTISASDERQRTEGLAKPRGDCLDPHLVHLQATVNQQGNQRFLTGTLSLIGCDVCPALAFSAIRHIPQ